MPQMGFEPKIPVFERAKTVHAWDRVTTVLGRSIIYGSKFFCFVAYDVTSVDINNSVFWDITPRSQLRFQSRQQRNIFMGTEEARTKNDCSGEDQQKITRPVVSEVHVSSIFRIEE
jgi:hypothetical protein